VREGKNAGNTGGGYERNHPDPDEANSARNSDGRQGIAAVRGGPPENGMRRPSGATLECAGRQSVAGIQISKEEPVDAHQEEGAEKMDFGYVGEGLRIPERSWRRVGKPEKWPIPRKIQRRGGHKGRIAPHQLSECKRAEGVGVLDAHPQSGETQEDLLDDGEHPIRRHVWSLAGELGVANSRCRNPR
jgi:hypothetical protein